MKTSLHEHTVKDLAQMAKKQGVAGWHSMRKAQLIRALMETKGASQSNGHSTAKKTSSGPKTSRKKRAAKVVRRLQEMQRQQASLKSLASGEGMKQDRLVLMVRDPYWLHAHWELQRTSIERAAAALGQYWHTAKPTLRLCKVSSEGTARNAESHVRDITIHGGVNNWYIDVTDPPCRYRVSIGYMADNETFHTLARSPIVRTPHSADSDSMDQNWDAVAADCEKIYAMSGGFDAQSNDDELKELFEERLRRPMGSPMVTRYGIGADPSLAKTHGFNLTVNAEMIVYGETAPNAHVTLKGEPIKVREDGSFTMRLAMPEKRQVIPVVASTIDGIEQRTVVLAVEKNTKVMETLIRQPEDRKA